MVNKYSLSGHICQVEPHGLKPMAPPHASEAKPSEAYPTTLHGSFEGYPPRLHPRSKDPCLPSPKRFVQAGVTARKRGFLRRRVNFKKWGNPFIWKEIHLNQKGVAPINPSTFPGLKPGVWRRRSIKEHYLT